jgi:uroporphyrinogen decarboxylase
MSPGHFREFFLPGIKRIIERTHQLGGYFMKHTDGNIWSLIEMLVEAGIDIIHPLEPIAGMDLGKVKQEYGDRVCIMGNVDCSYLLPFGTEKQIETEVKDCLRKAARGGGYILGSSNSIHSGVKPENFIAMVEAAKQHGTYR